MAKYLIVAREAMYSGSYGVEDWTIEELPNEQAAFAMAREMSLDLIDSYSDLYYTFRDNAEYWADNAEEEGEIWTAEQREEYIAQAIENQREDDIDYCVWKLSDDFDYSEVESEDYDWHDIVDLYAIEEY